MMVFLLITGVIAISLFAGRINFATRFNIQIDELFSQSKNISDKTFYFEQLSGLPEPVQRYFKHVLKEGQPYISYARLTHDGQFKTRLDREWVNIKGDEYFTMEKPGYIWKGTTSLVKARDMYIADKGRLIVTLLSLFNVVDGQGEEFNEAEFQRWVAESVWFPTNLLPSERFYWSEIGSNTAKLFVRYKELSVTFLVTINSVGEITQMQTNRFKETGKKEIWIGNMSHYQERNGIVIPTTIEVEWVLDKGHYPYAQFHVVTIENKMPA